MSTENNGATRDPESAQTAAVMPHVQQPQPPAITPQDPAAERARLDGFLTQLQKQPPQESIDPTPDGKAYTILISHIEMTLDEYFFGQWETSNFKWSVIANEVVGSIDLKVLHPVSGRELTRVGAAAIQIMVDRAPEGLNAKERNNWANDPTNKKPSALDMGFPKLKAECLKNAAQSLGKLFGRDLNRKKSDEFKALSGSTKKGQAAMAATTLLLNPDKA